jgi:hypothetical protein
MRYEDRQIGAGEERLGDHEAERFGGLEVDDQLELGGLLNWKIRGLHALEDLVDVVGGTAKQVGEICPAMRF